jgi:hypothetical protein
MVATSILMLIPLAAVLAGPAQASAPPAPEGSSITTLATTLPSFEVGPPSNLTAQQDQAGRLRWRRCHRDPDPKASVAVGPATVIGPASATDIDARVVTILEELRCCYGVEVEDDPTLALRMVVKILTRTSGTATGASIRSTTVQRPRLEACVAESFRHLVLPSVAGSESTVATIPLLLSP